MKQIESLAKLKELFDSGAINQSEFDNLKARIIDSNSIKNKSKLVPLYFILPICLSGIIYFGITNYPKIKTKSIYSATEELNNTTKRELNDITPYDENLKTFEEIQLTLTDATRKKANIYLGQPDKEAFPFSGWAKGYAIYFNKIRNQNGAPKHLVLFYLINEMSWGDDARIKEIHSVEDNERAYFGIHYIRIQDKNIYSNTY